jgi:hypothetical protein
VQQPGGLQPEWVLRQRQRALQLAVVKAAGREQEREREQRAQSLQQPAQGLQQRGIGPLGLLSQRHRRAAACCCCASLVAALRGASSCSWCVGERARELCGRVGELATGRVWAGRDLGVGR